MAELEGVATLRHPAPLPHAQAVVAAEGEGVADPHPSLLESFDVEDVHDRVGHGEEEEAVLDQDAAHLGEDLLAIRDEVDRHGIDDTVEGLVLEAVQLVHRGPDRPEGQILTRGRLPVLLQLGYTQVDDCHIPAARGEDGSLLSPSTCQGQYPVADAAAPGGGDAPARRQRDLHLSFLRPLYRFM